MGFSLDNVKKLATEQPVGLAFCSLSVVLCMVLLVYVWRRGSDRRRAPAAAAAADSKVECAV
jgi:hypothetical protein